MATKQKKFLGYEKVVEYLTSVIIVVSSNRFVQPTPKTRISCFLFPICTNDCRLLQK